MFAVALLIPIAIGMLVLLGAGSALIVIGVRDAVRFGTLSAPVLIPGAILTAIPAGFTIALAVSA